jgi:hypothetical protein
VSLHKQSETIRAQLINALNSEAVAVNQDARPIAIRASSSVFEEMGDSRTLALAICGSRRENIAMVIVDRKGSKDDAKTGIAAMWAKGLEGSFFVD